MKDVKKLLSKQANAILPDDKIKEDIRAELYGQGGVEAYAHGGTKAKGNRKTMYAIIAAALAVVIALCIILPITLGKNKPSSIIPGGIISTTVDSEDFYAYCAASAGSILAMQTQTGSASLAKAKLAADGITDSEQQAVTLIEEYISFVEEMLGNSGITHTTITSADGDGDYTYTMTVSYSDLLGENVSYVMYFNETQTSSKTDGDETEDNYDISGILVVNGVQYPVTGGRSEETETGETESELWFKAYTADNSYIIIKQEYEEETEDGENETEKTTEIYIYENGKLTESVVAEMENEDGETELELVITKNGVKNTIEFVYKQGSGDTVIQVKAEINGQKYSLKIYVENGNYRYVFSDGEYSSNRK
ncbi:MAG: hypothetical protein LUF82_07540 [Clostridia bacterium]|nr:hypothetical protein [Clostridia bacterium]